MPTRRHLIALTATAAAGISGCVEPPEEEDDENGEDGNVTDGTGNQTEDNETDTGDDEEDDGDDDEAEADFEFAGLSAPEEVELNEEFQVEFTVENVGDADGTYETEVRHHFAWSEYTFEDVSLEVPAGETATETWEGFSMPYIGWFEFETPDFDERVRTESTRPVLALEETFTTPRDVEITVLEIEKSDTYSYDKEGQNFSQTESTGDPDTVWAKAWVRCVNRSDSRRSLPALDEFDMSGSEGPAVDLTDDEDRELVEGYRPDTVSEGGSREGWVVIEVTDERRLADMSFYWEREFDEGESRARWDYSGTS